MDFTSQALPELPPSAQLNFLAEGGANIIYRFTLSSEPALSSDYIHSSNAENNPNTPQPTELEPLMYNPILDGKLLRLRKAVGWAKTQEISIRDFQETFLHLFDHDDLVAHDLVRLPEGLIAQCNAQLRADEQNGKRPAHRCGTYLQENEQHGMLVTDMSADLSRGELLLEFKPKWLAQSPTGPARAKRCRTCALNAQRRAQKRANASGGNASWCPLALVGTSKQVGCAIDALTLEKAADVRCEAFKDRLKQFFVAGKGRRLLLKVEHLQRSGDPFGILDESRTDPSSKEFLSAMTLRDCTLFVRVSDRSIEAKLGDLDSKTPDAGKLNYWRSLERTLIQEGWYTGEEIQKQSNDCLLSGP